MAIEDDIRLALRDYKTVTATYPLGDPSSPVWNPPKKTLRDALVSLGAEADALSASVVDAETSRAQAELAAIAAGATLYDSTADGLAGTVSGDVFLVSTEPGVQVYRNDTTATFLGWLGRVEFDTFGSFIASNTTFIAGTLVTVRDIQATYRAVAVTGNLGQANAGGQEFDVLPKNGAFHLDAFGDFSGEATGTRDNAVVAAAITAAFKSTLVLGSQSYDLSVIPAGVNDVHIIGNTRTKFTNVKLPFSQGVLTGGVETALVSGVIRYYPAGAVTSKGWYLLKNQGEGHDPILLSEVQIAAQETAIRVNVTLADLGLDPTLWTPSGVVVGADETFAKEGITFGASVNTNNILIQGSYNTPSNTQFAYSPGSSSWLARGSSGGNAPTYSATWVSGGTASARLRIIRTAGKRQASAGSWNRPEFIVTPNVTDATFTMNPYSILTTEPALNGNGDTFIDVMFFNLSDGTRIQTESGDMRLSLVDFNAQNTQFRFGPDMVEPFYGNIWLIGTFTRKSTSL